MLMDSILNRQRTGYTTQCRDILMRSEFLVSRLRRHTSLSGHHGCVNSVLFSDDGSIAITGSDDQTIKFFRVGDGEELKSIPTMHSNNIFYAKDRPFSQCNELLSCGADGRVLWTYDLARGSSSIILHRHEGRAHRIALVPDACDELYSCGEDGQCLHYDLRESPGENTGRVSLEFKARNHSRRAIYSISVNPRKSYEVALGGNDRYVRIYDTRGTTSEPIASLCPPRLRRTRVCVTGLKYNHSGHDLALSYNDDDVYIFSAPCGRCEGGASTTTIPAATIDSEPYGSDYSMVLRGHRNLRTVKQVSFLGDRSEWVVSGSDCGHVFIWQAATGRLVKVLPADPEGAVNCVTPHPTLPLLATSGLSSVAVICSPAGLDGARGVASDSSDDDEGGSDIGEEEYINRMLIPGGIRNCSSEKLCEQLMVLPSTGGVHAEDVSSNDDEYVEYGQPYGNPFSVWATLRRRIVRQAVREIRLELLERSCSDVDGPSSGSGSDDDEAVSWEVGSDSGSLSNEANEEDGPSESAVSSDSSVMEGEVDAGGYGDERRPLSAMRLRELHDMLNAFRSRPVDSATAAHTGHDLTSVGAESSEGGSWGGDPAGGGHQTGRRRRRAEMEEGSPGDWRAEGPMTSQREVAGHESSDGEDERIHWRFMGSAGRRFLEGELSRMGLVLPASSSDADSDGDRSESSGDNDEINEDDEYVAMETIVEDVDTYGDMDDISTRDVEFDDVD